MKLIVGQAPPPVPITEPPSVPCELTPELARFMAFPDLPAVVYHGLGQDEARQEPRAPGLHVSDLGYSADGGLCPRQLWLRLHGKDLCRACGGTGETGAAPGEICSWCEGHPTYDRKPTLEPQTEPGRRLGWARGHETEAWIAGLMDWGLGGTDWRLDERNGIGDYTHRSGQVLTGEFDIRLTNGKLGHVILDVKEVDDMALGRLDAPRPSNVCQIQGYVTACDADFGVLLYVARWGMKPFFVPRDDDAVGRRATEILGVFQSPDAPKVLPPKLTRKDNKGPDSVAVDSPWQCNYCPFLDHGCEGALPKACRGKGLWGHVDDDQKFKTKAGMEPVVDAFGHDRLAELLLS